MIASDELPSRCWAEIDLSALRHNAELARQQSGAAILAVIKADAYGHGAVEAAEALRDQAAVFGVANLEEARELKATGVEVPILLLSACLPDELAAAVGEGYHVCVSSVEEAALLQGLAEERGVPAHVHAVLDTGMGRMGFTDARWNADTVRQLLGFPSLRWEGLASHFPSSDEDVAFSLDQIAGFRRAVDLAGAGGLKPRWIHLANSAGLLGYAETRGLCNLARPGLMLYGVDPLEGQLKGEDAGRTGAGGALQPVLTWKTRVALVRELPPGHGVSYGRTFITTRRTRVATLAAGYADGYPRQVSGHGAAALIQGKRCPLLGRVTMDQIMVDVTDLEMPVHAGDEAVLLGAQGETAISSLELAAQAGTIAWHVFTGISGRVKRVYHFAASNPVKAPPGGPA